MSRTRMHQLAELGQSVWLDFTDRSFVLSGGLQNYVDQGLRGVTSNPSIFEKAIAEGGDYDDQIRTLAHSGQAVQEIYEELTIDDSRMAADILRPVFDQTRGEDGFFSLEVEPHLAHDTGRTMESARRLFKAVDRPNLMIKVPATPEGMPAIRDLTAEGLNINITLMFSLSQYDQVAEAFIQGLEQRAAQGRELGHISSVASLFVSRVDTKIDKLLDGLGTAEASALKGRIAIANARVAYQHYKQAFGSSRWKELEGKGARPQRVLYASTSTKNPDYPELMYVESLIGPQTVDTIPPETLQAFLEHGRVELTLEQGLEEAHRDLLKLREMGIDLEEACRQVLDEGVEKFNKPYDSLMQTLAAKKDELIAA